MKIEDVKVGQKVRLNLKGKDPYFGWQGANLDKSLCGAILIDGEVTEVSSSLSLLPPLCCIEFSWHPHFGCLLKEIEPIEEAPKSNLINIGPYVKMKIVKEISPANIFDHVLINKDKDKSLEWQALFEQFLELTKETGFFKQPSIDTLEKICRRWPSWFNWFDRNGFIERVKETKTQKITVKLESKEARMICNQGKGIVTENGLINICLSNTFQEKINKGMKASIELTIKTEE